MKLIIKLHEYLLENVDYAHKKQKQTFVARKGRIIFHSFGDDEMFVKMWKLGKKNSMLAN
jgi:hypothetical protein